AVAALVLGTGVGAGGTTGPGEEQGDENRGDDRQSQQTGGGGGALRTHQAEAGQVVGGGLGGDSGVGVVLLRDRGGLVLLLFLCVLGGLVRALLGGVRGGLLLGLLFLLGLRQVVRGDVGDRVLT